MGRLLVEILISASGAQASAGIDEVGASADRTTRKVESLIQSALRGETALRRTAEGAERLKDQMEETKAAKGMIADLGALNTKLREELQAVKEGAVGLERLNQKRREEAQAARIASTQVRAGVSAESEMGKAIALEIREQDRLQAELRQTAAARAAANLAATTTSAAPEASTLSKFASSARSALMVVTAVTATVTGLGYSIKKLADIASEEQDVFAQLSAGVRSTGASAGYTAQELLNLASSLSHLTGIDDEVIAGGESILLTFQRIRSQGSFADAMADSMDIAARKGMDLNAAVTLTGKLYSGSLDSAKKAGIIFTDSQKEQIKHLFATGRAIEAQTIIHQHLQRAIGGSAAAARDTLGGAMRAASTESGNLMEVLAGQLSPVIRKLTEDYVKWAQSAEAQEHMAELGRLLADAIEGAASAAKLLGPGLKVIGLELKIILAVIGPVLNAIGWLGEKLEFARDTYIDAAKEAGFFRDTIRDSTPQIVDYTNSQMDAVLALREEYGKLGQAAVDAARAQLDAMSAEAKQAEDLAAKNRQLLADRDKTRKRNVEIGAIPKSQGGPGQADRDLAESARLAEERAKNLHNIIGNLNTRLKGHAKAAAAAASGEEDFGNSLGKARENARKMIADLIRERDETDAQADSIKLSTEAYEAQLLAQKQDAAVRRIREPLLEAGIDLTTREIGLIRSLVVEIEASTKAVADTKAWTEAWNKARASIKPIDIKADIKALAEWAEKAMAGTNALRDIRARGLAVLTSIDAETAALIRGTKAHTDYIQSLQVEQEIASRLGERTAANAEIYDALAAELKVKLPVMIDAELALSLKDSLATPRDELKTLYTEIDRLAKTCDAAGEPILSAAEAEALRANAAAQFMNEQLSGWSSFMSDLGNIVGGGFGHIMSQVSRAIQTIQAGQSAGTQLGGLMNASAGTTAMLGAVGMYVAAAKIAYDFFKSAQANRYSRGYGYAGVTGMEAGQGWEIGAGMTGRAREASRQIQEAARTLAEAMGGVITSFASIEIQVRRDGKYFKAFVAGELIGKFEDINDAINAAIIAGFKSGKTSLFGLSDLVRQGLDQALNTTSGTALEFDSSDLQQFLGSLREIAELSWSDSARQVSATTNHLHDLLGTLLKMGDASPAVMQGFDDIRASLVRTFQDWRRSLTGQEMSSAEARALQESEIKLFNARKALEIARLKQEYEAYKGHAAIVAGEGQTTRQFFLIKKGELDGYAAFIQARGTLAQAEAEIYGSTTDAIKAALEATIAALEAIPDIDISEVGKGGRGDRGGGGGRGDDRASFRQDIKDRMAEFLGEVSRMFYGLDQEMADLSARAKELGIPLSELNELFGKMQEGVRKNLKNRMDDLAGKGMSDIGKQLEEGLAFFAELRKKGRKETGIPDWKVDVREEQFKGQIKGSFQQSLNEFAGLSDPMLQIKMRAAELRKGLQELAAQGLLTAEEIQHAKDMIAGGEEIQRQQAIGGIMSQVYGYLKDSAKYAQEEAELKKEMELINLRMLEAQLKMLNAWDDHTAQVFAGAAEAIRNGIVAGFAGGGAGGGLNDMIEAAEEYYKQLQNQQKEAADILKGWRDAGKTPLQRELDQLAEEMEKVTDAFGLTAEITQLHAERLRAIITSYLEPLQSALDQQQTGGTSSLTGEQKFFESQRQFRALAGQAQAAIASGDLGAIPDPQELRRLFDQYLEFAQGYTGGEGFRFIESEARGVFQSILSAIPGLARAGAAGGGASATGSATSPFTTQSPALQAAIETGNTLLLSEARNQTAILAQIRNSTRDMAGSLYQTLSVRMVA